MTPIAVEKGAKELRKEEDISWTERRTGDVTFNVLPHRHHLMPVLGTDGRLRRPGVRRGGDWRESQSPFCMPTHPA